MWAGVYLFLLGYLGGRVGVLLVWVRDMVEGMGWVFAGFRMFIMGRCLDLFFGRVRRRGAALLAF